MKKRVYRNMCLLIAGIMLPWHGGLHCGRLASAGDELAVLDSLSIRRPRLGSFSILMQRPGSTTLFYIVQSIRHAITARWFFRDSDSS